MLPPERKANVYELAVQRLDRVFRDFDNIYVSFSGGKDSGALLNMPHGLRGAVRRNHQVRGADVGR